MAVSPGCAMAALGVPPLRGALSVFMLFVLSLPVAIPPEEGIGLGGRVVLLVFGLLVGVVPWVMTLSGFVRDLGVPEPRSGQAVLALRTRRTSAVVSWIALALVVVTVPAFAVLVERLPDHPVTVAVILGLPVALLVASVLPALSRRYVLAGGIVAADPEGLQVHLRRGRTRSSEGWPQLDVANDDPRPAVSLPGKLTADLGLGVRWRPGAREAVARWSTEGFAPTASEVRTLGLDPDWSPDPRAGAAPRGVRWVEIAFMGWAALFCASALAGMVVMAVVGTGTDRWVVPLLLGWAPALGLFLLVPRLVRMLTEDPDEPVRVAAEGWDDRYHRQGLVRWQDIAAIHVQDRAVVLVSRPASPPFRDPDLANRLNARVVRAQARSRVKIPSAGPGYRPIGDHILVYPAGSGVLAVLDEAERVARPYRRDPLVVRADDDAAVVAP